jgi:ABC-type glycerol-3-phosphate transport system substrate-binding protein
MVYRDVSKGSLTFDAMLAAGNPPDVWIDAGSYMADYLHDGYAIQLDRYVNTSIYRPELLAPWTRNGHIYALPLQNIATGMAINLDMLKTIGYTMPTVDKWTTTEFLALAARLKTAGYPATMVMGRGGMNSWTDVWLYAFGAEMFKGTDYSRVAINTPQAIQGLEYIKTLVERGYTPPPLEVNDDDGVELFTTGRVFSCMMQNGHSDYWIPEQVRQGKIAAPINVTFVEFPHAPGRQHTPVSGYQTVTIAHKSGNATRDKLIADLAAAVTGKQAQWYYSTITGGFPTLKDFAPEIGTAAMPTYKAIAGLAQTAGVYKEYPDGPKGREVRRIWYVLSEQWLRGRLTSQAFLAQFEAEANRALR